MIIIKIRTDSQDAWIFQTPMDTSVIKESNFYLGIPRCDNRIAYILFNNNYTVINPGFYNDKNFLQYYILL